MKRQSSASKWDIAINVFVYGLASVFVLGLVGFGVWIWMGLTAPDPSAQLAACKSNLKNIGTACEMYSTDFKGAMPPSMDRLTPNYLKTIPRCPVTKDVTYHLSVGPRAPMNSTGGVAYYYIECVGGNHAAVGTRGNYPAYNGVRGVIERAP